MRYVILRDDDTNAFTPVDCLERLYRPFLDRGLPVNLAVIPEVATDTRMPNGSAEGFLVMKTIESPRTHPIGSNEQLVRYLLERPGYYVVQHGCHHEYMEFDRPSRLDVAQRLEQGMERLLEAGFARPQTFVAPYDKLSRASLVEVRRRFRVLSTGWYELRRLPLSWWPKYAWKKMKAAPHWQIGNTLLLTHPGCLLSCQRSRSAILEAIIHHINTSQLTVLVTHWWEYFRDHRPDEPFIELLHETADYLATDEQIKVISFSDLATGRVALN